MPSPCEGCALTCGAAANKEAHNHLKAMIAVLAPIPFYCHDAFDWQDDLAQHYPPRLLKQMGQLRQCAGWRREVTELAATGYYKDDPRWTKLAGLRAMGALNEFSREDATAEEKRDAFERLGLYVGLLVEKKRKFIRGREAALAAQEP